MRGWLTAAVVAAAVSGGCASSGSGTPSGRSATFEARNAYEVKVPAGAKRLRAWFALPQDDPAQRVKDLTAWCPYDWKVVVDNEGNSYLFVEAEGAALKDFSVQEGFTITRWETRSDPDASKTRPITAADREKFAAYLGPNKNVPITDEMRRAADAAVGKEENPVRAARLLYDWTLKNVEYWVKDPANKKASPVGSSEYCMTTKTGNCTDFHSLWTALARSKGIPTRIVYGSFFKKELDGQDKDQSYHCWIEFWAPNLGWICHDVAVADIFVGDFALNAENGPKVQLTTAAGYSGADPKMVDYYFGNIEERRVTWSRGRDLVIPPGQSAGTVNALPKAYVEVDGAVLPEGAAGWTRKLTFREIR